MADRIDGSVSRAATVVAASAAAVGVARGAGIELEEEPLQLPGVANTVLGFPEAGVVAKVGTRPRAKAHLPTEHALAAELALLGAPAARPLGGVAPAVHVPTGFMVTLWHWVDHDPSSMAEPQACAEALAVLHDALDATTTPLPSFLVELGQARSALGDDDFMDELPPADRAFLRAAFDASLAELDGFRYVPRRLHGEPHEANYLLTPEGVVWVDLESACTGPREWDLAFLTGQPAEGPFASADRGLLDCLRRLNHARLATWRWGVLKSHPDLRPFAEGDLAYLRRTRTG